MHSGASAGFAAGRDEHPGRPRPQRRLRRPAQLGVPREARWESRLRWLRVCACAMGACACVTWLAMPPLFRWGLASDQIRARPAKLFSQRKATLVTLQPTPQDGQRAKHRLPLQYAREQRRHCVLTMSLDIRCEQLNDARWIELLPLIQQHQVVRLEDCGLTEGRCKDISTALRANSALTELSLRTNELGDAGVCLVLQGLQSSTCKVQNLSLQNCGLSETGCRVLASVLRCTPTLRELHLSDNPLGDTGLRLLSEGLLDPQSRLEKLELESCNLSAASCEPLAAILRAKPNFKELVVSNNCIQEAGIRVLCGGLKDSTCLLEMLRLDNCGVTSANCKDLGDVVAAKPSLQELDLGGNRLGDVGIAALCPGLLHPSCRLRKLWLWECDITAEGCRDLCQVLRAKQSLKALSLMLNELGNEGARLLCEALQEPSCQLECLWVRVCSLTDTCCPHFRVMLAQNKFLTELQLGENKLGDTGVQELCEGLGQPGSVLRVLGLGDCDLTDNSCSNLASVLLASCSLRELDLSNNGLGDPGVLQLVESLRQPGCILECLLLFDVYLSDGVNDQLQALEEEKPSLRIIS